MTRQFHRKTELGVREVAERTLGLPRLLRTLLILVAPHVSAEELSQRIGDDAEPKLEALVAMGLIEVVVPVARLPAEPVAPVTLRAEAPLPPPTPAPPPPPPPSVDLRAAKSLALVELAPVFGPEVDSILGGLLAADSSTALASELDALREKLVMYQGRRRADALIRKITDAS
ncbi:MAG: hypothetical protein V4844_17460 [Pseudomonadota bacterium]